MNPKAIAPGVADPATTDVHLHVGQLPGAIGRITQLHGAFSAAHSGFGVAFEAKVARELAEFCATMDPDRDGLWLAVRSGEILGSIAIDGARAGDEGAHLRWFIVADESRGAGVGSRLLGAAMAFCRRRAYRRVYLWTFDQLHAARHLYEKHGFQLVKAQIGRQWGTDVNEQLFVRSDA